MCIPVPPSVGSQTKAVTTEPIKAVSPIVDPNGIDYSKYAGKSPYEVQTQMHPEGLPTGWSWDEWMRVNAVQPDPRNHTNTGALITPEQLAQWQPRAPTAPPVLNQNPNPFTRPSGTPSLTSPAPAPANPVNRVATTPAVTKPLAADPAPADKPGAQPVTAPVPVAQTPLGQGGSLFFGNAPVTYTQGAYRTDPAYSPGETQLTDPVAKVSNTITRRYRPKDWF